MRTPPPFHQGGGVMAVEDLSSVKQMADFSIVLGDFDGVEVDCFLCFNWFDADVAEFRFEPFEPFVHGALQLGDLPLKPSIHLLDASVHSFHTSIHSFHALVHVFDALVHVFDAFVHRVRLFAQRLDLALERVEFLMERFELLAHIGRVQIQHLQNLRQYRFFFHPLHLLPL